MLKNYMKEGQKLPLFGVGPYIVYGMAMVNIVGIILFGYVFKVGILPDPWILIFRIVGGLLITSGLTVWYIGSMRSDMNDSITENRLLTKGIYSWVRNPMYSGWWISLSGGVLLWHNVWMLILPVLDWLIMTVALINTEEKRLFNLYGDEYAAGQQMYTMAKKETPTMSERIRKNTVISCWVIFAILIVVHGFEAIVLRMDETVFGENFINKIFGILVIFIVLRCLDWKWSDIGFSKTRFAKGIGLGLLIAMCSFLISYSVEIIILKSGGHNIDFGIFTTGFSLTGEADIHTGIGFILMCVFFNIINVIMEEGTFRGLFYHISAIDHSSRYALLFQALLFGVWHIVTPLHNLIDGDINIGSFIALGIGYIILAGMMSIKWELLYRMTGSLYAGMADHFFNNCIATNLLHVITESGVDEMMIIRVAIAQLLSFAVVLLVWAKREKTKQKR